MQAGVTSCNGALPITATGGDNWFSAMTPWNYLCTCKIVTNNLYFYSARTGETREDEFVYVKISK